MQSCGKSPLSSVAPGPEPASRFPRPAPPRAQGAPPTRDDARTRAGRAPAPLDPAPDRHCPAFAPPTSGPALTPPSGPARSACAAAALAREGRKPAARPAVGQGLGRARRAAAAGGAGRGRARRRVGGRARRRAGAAGPGPGGLRARAAPRAGRPAAGGERPRPLQTVPAARLQIPPDSRGLGWAGGGGSRGLLDGRLSVRASPRARLDRLVPTPPP